MATDERLSPPHDAGHRCTRPLGVYGRSSRCRVGFHELGFVQLLEQLGRVIASLIEVISVLTAMMSIGCLKDIEGTSGFRATVMFVVRDGCQRMVGASGKVNEARIGVATCTLITMDV